MDQGQTASRGSRARVAGIVAIGLCAAAACLSGCAVRQALMNRVGDAVAEGGTVYASDADVELVGAASPFGLKLLESLSEESPRHRGLLLALARGYTQYAYAYVEMPADFAEQRDVAGAYLARERARRLYLRARDYGLRGLELAHPEFRRQLAADPDAALRALGTRDVPLAYWTAAAWGAAISLGKDNADLLAGLPEVRELAARALELDERYDAGALELLSVSLAMSEAGPERIVHARRHLSRALELSGGRLAAPYVVFAEAVSVPTGNRVEFDSLIGKALAVDPEAAPQQRLANTLFQRRAHWLQSHSEDLFNQ